MGRQTKRTKMGNIPRETKPRNSDSIPIDLLFGIFLRLPTKSIARFVNVSKLFATIIRSRDFIRSYSFRSSLQQKQKQRTLLAFSEIDKEKGCENWHFFSSSLTLEEDESSSSLVFLSRTACHVPDLRYERPDCVHGLMSFVYGQEQIICNPRTGKSITLPIVKSRRRVLKRFFGYDPIDDQYKALCVTELTFGTGMRVAPSGCQVLTLGSSSCQNSLRKIECSIPHHPQSTGLCVNGVLYYCAYMGTKMMEPCFVRFDVRSETFDFVTRLSKIVQYLVRHNPKLINYQGNVALATESTEPTFDLWVLEDAIKQEWSRVSLWSSKFWFRQEIRGTTHTGEIIYASYYVDDFYLIHHDHKMDGFKRVEIEENSEYEFGRFAGVASFLDYVESVMFS